MSRTNTGDAAKVSASLADTRPFEPIARFANIAEAGYFHSELEGHMGCEVRLSTQDHFDAASASWWSDYVLTVPATQSSEAVATLKQLVRETDQAEFLDYGQGPSARPATRHDTETVSHSRIDWAPIVLTLAAGTFVVWATQQAQQQWRGPVDGGADHVSLWDKMGEGSEPWVQRPNDGRGRREVSFDPHQNSATLREDTDGDGILDRVSRLPITE